MSASARTGYDYERSHRLEDAGDLHTALRYTVWNYFHDQLGLSKAFCEARVEKEETRAIPKSTMDRLEATWGWRLREARLLDVGAGQGGGVLEALERGADAYGVEPGPEFSALARMRVEAAGYDAARLRQAPGEALPFPDAHFDYVISLQVLEHVADPRPVLREMYRVLKPGGQCYVSCENYLSFREQHYRVAWLPLLPRPLGRLYLRLRGRDPAFFQNYVYYTTYPQIAWQARKAGFTNETFAPHLERFRQPGTIRRAWARPLAQAAGRLPAAVLRRLVRAAGHAQNLFRVGTRLALRKPATASAASREK